MEGIKSCAIFGHDPIRFAWGFDEEAAACYEMKTELAQQIMVLRQQGVTQFSVACDYGVGLYAAEIINALRDNTPELLLFCVTPYEEQAAKWTPALRERYFDMLVKWTANGKPSRKSVSSAARLNSLFAVKIAVSTIGKTLTPVSQTHRAFINFKEFTKL